MHPLLQRADRVLRESAGALSIEALTRAPAGRWSAAEILEHLGLTFTGTSRGLQRLLEHGQAPPQPRTIEQRAGRFLVLHAGYFPKGYDSPEARRPRGADPGAVLDTTLAHLAAMDGALDSAELHFGPRLPVMQHPLLGTLSVHEWRRFHWLHTRHHARQIRQRSRG